MTFTTTTALRRGIILALAAASTALSCVASAQTAPAAGASSGLEDVVVTAERRESNLQSTPIAVTAVDTATIAELAPRTISDLATLVPNFSATKITGFNAASFAMRGVGKTDIIVYSEAPVAVLVDDFVLQSSQTQLLDPFDVQEVEVLRGPQGTLFGKNTTGGAIVVRTKAPSLTDTTFDAQVAAGSYNALTTQGAVSIPLITDKLGLRIVASEEREDGWMRNGATTTIGFGPYAGTYHGDGSRIGGTRVFTGRAKLLWQPTDNLKVAFTYEMLNDRSQAPGAINSTPSGSWTNPLTGNTGPYYVFTLLGLNGYTGNDPLNNAGMTSRSGLLIDMQNGHRVDADGEHLNVDWTTAAGTVTWVQGYRGQDSSLPSNYTGVVGPLSVFDANRSDIRKTWQEEVRFASKQLGQFNYVVGGFYQHDDTKFCVAQILGISDLFGAPIPAGAAPGGYNNNPEVLCNAQKEKSSALFGEANYQFTETTTLSLGARITKDSKDWIGRQQVLVQYLSPPTGQPQGTFNPAFTWQTLGSVMNAANFSAYPYGVVSDSHTWTQPTYRLTLSHQFDPSLFGYGTFSHGFRAGGYNDQVGTGGTPITADERKPTNPEKADSFEIGVKADLLDHRVRLNEALFYVRYKDAIRQVVTPVTDANGNQFEETLFRNAAAMKVYGIENELTAKLAEGLLVRVPLSYQKCKYSSFTSGTGAAAVDLSGLPVNRCPEWTATVDLNYTVPVTSTGGDLVFDANANYVAKNLDFYSIQAGAPSFTQTFATGRTLVGASVTYNGANDRWFARALVRNLTNKKYIDASENVDPLWIFTFYGEPRFVSGQLGYKFGGSK